VTHIALLPLFDILRTLSDIYLIMYIAIYGGLFVTFHCLLLGLTHRAYRIYFFGSFFLSALISIFVEQQGRRKELAVYVLNVGLETLFRMMVSRGKYTENFATLFFFRLDPEVFTRIFAQLY
jgi:hypothetical protein